jgi:hypothetical protein
MQSTQKDPSELNASHAENPPPPPGHQEECNVPRTITICERLDIPVEICCLLNPIVAYAAQLANCARCTTLLRPAFTTRRRVTWLCADEITEEGIFFSCSKIKRFCLICID